MKAIKIIKCSDSLLWYAKLIGHTVEFIKEVDEGFLSREPSGYTNIVRREDAEIINEESPCKSVRLN